MSRPLTFPRMTGSEAQALAALVTRGPGHLLQGALPGDQSGHLRLAPLAPGQQPIQPADTQRLRIEWAGGQLAIDVAPWVLDRWLLMTLGLSNLASLPAAFRPVAVEHLINQMLQGLSGAGRGPAQLMGMELAGQRPAQNTHAVQLELHLADGQVLPALLHMDSLALMLIGSLAQAAPEPAGSDDVEDLPVALQLCIGQTELPAAQLKQLCVGALVFMVHNHLGPKADGLLLRTPVNPASYWCAQARLEGHQIIFLTSATLMNNPLPTNADDADIDLEHLPVHLSFDLGHKTVTLSQLRQLGEGQALQLERPVDQGVTIRANGAAIGLGQLVDIDGRMGVLISKLHGPMQEAGE